MGVLPEWHRRGVGGGLIARLETDAAAAGRRFLTVKTLAPSDPDPHYAATRCFYERSGFTALQELPGFWGPDTPCLMMIKQI